MLPLNSETDRLIYLLKARATDQLSPQEAAELDLWLKSNLRNRQFGEAYGSLDQLLEILKKRKKIDTEAALLRVQIQTGQVETHKREGVIWAQWWKYAAAAAVLLLFFGYWYTEKHSIEKPVAHTVVSEIKPGGNKATLTLSDGHNINLEEAKTGEIAKQAGMKIAKTSDGQLVYAADNRAGGARVSGYNKISTPKGGQYQISLSDGTRVWLNALSSIRFPAAFGLSDRRVEVTGEAYFEVAKKRLIDHNMAPFRVVSRGQTIEVTGTHFNVNAYQDEQEVTTTLLEGSVRVSQTRGKNRHAEVRLRPGEQSVVKDQKPISVRELDPQEAVAWKNGYFRYQKTSIREIMRQMSRWYDIEVHYEDKTVPGDRFTGFVSRSVTLSNALKMLEEGGGVKFRIEEKNVFVKSIE